MSEKRYAIVRVDNNCPPIKMFCSDRKIDCKNCLYGDTKEQLIRKVEQIIGIRFARNYRFGVLVDEIKKGLAKEIVEFLGVEDDK